MNCGTYKKSGGDSLRIGLVAHQFHQEFRLCPLTSSVTRLWACCFMVIRPPLEFQASQPHPTLNVFSYIVETCVCQSDALFVCPATLSALWL